MGDVQMFSYLGVSEIFSGGRYVRTGAVHGFRQLDKRVSGQTFKFIVQLNSFIEVL